MSGRPWMIGLLLIMALICSTALSVVNHLTSPIIQLNEKISYMSTVLDVFGISYDPLDKEGIISTYEGRVEESQAGGLTIFRDTSTGATAVELSGGGFQGPLSFVVALDGTTITGFKVVSQAETPGLGARITEAPFQQQFIGKDVANGISMVKSDAGPSQFDAITGATETSRALEKILNRGFEQYFSAAATK